MIISNRGDFQILLKYLYRVLTRTSPHGKGCKCSKWGYYVGECPFPSKILVIEPGPSARIGDSSPAEHLHISGNAKEMGIHGIGTPAPEQDR